MKKTITFFSILFAMSLKLAAQQDSDVPLTGTINTVKNVQAQNQIVQRGSNPIILSCDTLLTTFAGGNNHRGNMFDITAINTVTILSFDGSPESNTSYEIYYKSGTYVGSENNSGAWTLAGSAPNVVSNGSGNPTPLTISMTVTIPAGQTYAFYVTSSNVAVSQDYTNGTNVGNVFSSDANIQFKEGCGLEYPFSGTPFTPRVWNGRIHYCPGTTTGLNEQTLSTVSCTIIPNPFSTTAVIHLRSGNFTPGMQVKIYDVVGNEVSSMNNLSGNDIRLEKGSLNTGLYFYTIIENNIAVGKGKIIIN